MSTVIFYSTIAIIFAIFTKKLLSMKKTNISSTVIEKSSGEKSLIMLDAGTNKATVLATLRQLTGIDYPTAKEVVNSTPKTIFANISETEAEINKQALEFVGAKLEIK